MRHLPKRGEARDGHQLISRAQQQNLRQSFHVMALNSHVLLLLSCLGWYTVEPHLTSPHLPVYSTCPSASRSSPSAKSPPKSFSRFLYVSLSCYLECHRSPSPLSAVSFLPANSWGYLLHHACARREKARNRTF